MHDLAALLLRALTLEKKLRPSTKLPAPFDRIVPNGINGTWGLREMAEALTPTTQPAFNQTATSPLTSPAPSPSAAAVEDESRLDSVLLYRRRNHIGTVPVSRRGPLWAALAIVAVIALGVFLRAGISKPANEPQIAATPATTPEPVRQAVVKEAPAPTPTTPAVAQPVAQTMATAHMQSGWYVVAYTFNRQQQAVTRAAAIAQKNPSLHPEIIAPGGHAPFLVALGGAMSRPEAENTRNLARQAGMPRDTFVRNYKGN